MNRMGLSAPSGFCEGTIMSDWKQFEQYIKWQDLLDQYLEALNHVERFRAQHPERELSQKTLHALHVFTAMYGHMRPLIGNAELLKQCAPPDAIRGVLGIVGRVRQQLPLFIHTGSA
jgi:hypothetical protein